MQHASELPQDVARQIVARLNSSGNAARARAVSRTWLAANASMTPHETAQRASATRLADQKWALEAALAWVRGDARRTMYIETVDDRWTLLQGCRVSRSCPLGMQAVPGSALTVQEVIALAANLASITRIFVTDRSVPGGRGRHQTMYPLLSTAQPRFSNFYYDTSDLDAAGRIHRDIGRGGSNSRYMYNNEMPWLVTRS